MKKIARAIVCIAVICLFAAGNIQAYAFSPYYAVQYGTYVSAYEKKNGYVDDEFNRSELYDEEGNKLQIDKSSGNQLHVEGYGWLPPSDSDKLMYVTKLSKRYVASAHANLYDYYGDPHVLDKGDIVYLTGAKKNGRVGVLHIGEDGTYMYGWMSASRLGVKKKVQRRCHYYRTASSKYPKGYLAKGKTVYIIKTSGVFSYAYGIGWVKKCNLR